LVKDLGLSKQQLMLILIFFLFFPTLGTAQSVGCKVDGLNPHDIIEKVNSGEYNVPEK
jgi:hypothetical protein